jgi:hypothetical protein
MMALDGFLDGFLDRQMASIVRWPRSSDGLDRQMASSMASSDGFDRRERIFNHSFAYNTEIRMS